MYSSSAPLNLQWRSHWFNLSKNPKIARTRFLRNGNFVHFLNSPQLNGLESRSSEIQRRCDSVEFQTVLNSKMRASSKDEQFGLIPEEHGKPDSDFAEFITSERVKVVAMLALALVLCNADRVVMSVAIVPLSLAHGWSRSFCGIVQSSFLWGYLLSPIAGGTLVDRHGGKVIMGWGVALWSLATFLTPWAAETSLWLLLALRSMLGIAEGLALPCMNNMVARWFQTERARAVGIAMAGFTSGNAIGLMLAPILMSQAGIFGPFVIFGLCGFLWVLVWLSATASTPDRHPQISKYELEYILNEKQKPLQMENDSKTIGVIPPFRQLLSKMPIWAVIIANGMHSLGFFIILSWMPTYFNSVYQVNLRQASWFSAVPWGVMAIIGYFAGLAADILIKRGTSVTLTARSCRNRSSVSGVIHGMAMTAGTLAAILGTIGAGYFVELVGSFQGFMLLTSLLYFLSALFYIIFSTGDRLSFDKTVLR